MAMLRRIACGVAIALLFACNVPLLVAADGAPVATLPASLWKAPADARVTLSDAGGVLAVDYDVEINQTYRVGGYKTVQEARFLILRSAPIDISADQARVVFESRNALGARDSVAIRPVIEDQNGERISYAPELVDGFAGRNDGWQLWRSHPFYMTEAGGAAISIYDATGGDQNAWPDGHLRFIGFEVRIAKPADKEGSASNARHTGRILLGDIRLAGTVNQQANDVAAYADALFSEAGSYRMAFETRAAFQGRPVLEQVRTIIYDPASEKSRRQIVSLPDAGLRNSWVRYRITRTETPDVTVTEKSLRWERNVVPEEQKIPAGIDLTQPPAVGLVRMDPTTDADPLQVGGVFHTEAMTPAIRVFAPSTGAEDLQLLWVLTPYGYSEPRKVGSIEIKSTKQGAFTDISLPLNGWPDHDVYQLRYTLVRGADKHTLDSGEYLLGIAREQIAQRLTRQGNIPDRNDIKSRAYFRTTFLQPGNDKPKTEADAIRNVRLMLSESKQMTEHVAYSIDVSSLEVLPGVYDFSLLDQVMDAAADNGCAITIMLGHSESKAPFQWHPYTRTRNFDGSVLEGHRYYGSFALTDQVWMDSWKRAFHALYTRYGKHPGFEGYYLMKPGGEWILPDEPWAGHISDYSWSSIASFRQYLSNELKLDLAALNKRWGTRYQQWSEVMPPQPDLTSGAKPDLRPQWTDFSNCKLNWNDSWTLELSRDIRTYDTRRPILAYVRLMEEPVEKLAGLIDYQHNGGLHGFEAEGMLVDAWEKYKIGWITEPHYPHHWAWDHDGWVLDWSVYVMLSQAGGGGANIHIYYHPRENLSRYYPHEADANSTSLLQSQERYALSGHYGAAYAYDRFEHFKPILRELHNFKLDETPRQVAVIHDRTTLLAKHRTTFRARMLDLSRWFDLLKQDSVDFEYFRRDRAAQYKMIVLNPLDEVVSQSTLDDALSAVRQGAWLVMGARTGAYVAEKPDELYPLLKAFNIAPPTREFSITADGQTAAIDPAWQDKLKPVRFFTQSDMKKRLADPDLNYLEWAYRWMPQADYYGIFAGQSIADGQVLARFADQGAAVSLHNVGRGKVIVFWGTPDLEAKTNQGLMASIARLAGVTNPKAGNPVAHMLEGSRPDLGRRYALLFQNIPGRYQQKLASVPDGQWFVDDMVSGERYGLRDGKDLREKGIVLEFTGMSSPLKALRLIDGKQVKSPGWAAQYPLGSSQETRK